MTDADRVIVDTLWQTETGGHLITNLPALEDTSNDEDLGDTTTLRDPSVLEQIREPIGGD